MSRLAEISAELLVMAGLGLVLGLLGPFGTFAMPLATRIIVWLLFALSGYACFRPVIGAGRALAELTPVPLAASVAIACAVAALPATVLVAWISHGFAKPDGTDLAGQYPYVLLVGGLATAIQFLLFGRRVAPEVGVAGAAPPVVPRPASLPEPAPPPAPPVTPPFLDRLPPGLGRDLLCLEMEDHYLRAHTAAGSTLLLMRMRDAVGEVGGIEGERVHRSWWVARVAIEAPFQRDRATWLRLTNGLEVPVARNTVPLLRAKGWL